MRGASAEEASAGAVYSRPRSPYIAGRIAPDTVHEEAAMRAEPQKHVDAIRESLALLRRHL